MIFTRARDVIPKGLDVRDRANAQKRITFMGAPETGTPTPAQARVEKRTFVPRSLTSLVGDR
jgi:hypothetical protein